MNCFLSSRSIKLCLILALAAIGSASAEEGLPTQDQALALALENHPDIVAAKAKVALANAELYGKRIEVSRQVIAIYGSLKKLELQVDVAKAAMNRAKAAAETSTGTVGEAKAAEAELALASSQREQAERELRLLVGKLSPVASRDSGERLGIATNAAVKARQAPKGPVVEKMKVALEKPIKLDFAEIPLEEIMSYLTEKSGVSFSLQKRMLEDAGIGSDQPITIRTNEVSLQAAIEAFEDNSSDLVFVLRDYGVLLTTKEYAEEHGYTPVLELEKQSGASGKAR